MTNAQSTTWLQEATQAINEAVKDVKPDTTVNVTIYAPVTNTNIDNRSVTINNGRSPLPTIQQAQALCHPSRHQLTGSYSEKLANMSMTEIYEMWDREMNGSILY
jgi:hypothetical protein